MTTRSPSFLHTEQAAQQARAKASALLSERDQIAWLMGSATGRANWFRLCDAGRLFDDDITNTTATTQYGIAAVHSFVKKHLYAPALKHCPELFLQARAEHERSTAERAPNTN